MARVLLGLLAACAAAVATSAASSSSSSVSAPTGFSLQLHRGAAPLPARRRRTQTLDGEREVVPLKPGLGTHFAWVYAGTPPQRASVIADTGSSLMAFPCSGCDGCGSHTDEPFAIANSTSLSHVMCKAAPALFRCRDCGTDPGATTCSISQSYMEGSSWEAAVVDDIVYLGGEDSADDERLRDMFGTRFKFGCQRKETGLFITQVADGIMGLANNGDNIVAKLHREKKIPANLFSLCFADGGGSMSIGTPNTVQHRGEVEYAKLAKDTMRTDFYNVHLRDVRVDNVSIEAPASSFSHGHFIVDSGTTDSYLPSSMKSSFEAAFKKATGLDYQASGAGCKGYNDEQLAKLPNIQIVLEAENGTDLVLQVPPDQYLIQEKGHYCANVFLTEFSGGVIGANIMQDRDVIFDSDNHRVGFVDADCTYVENDRGEPTSSNPPRDHPAPGVVASSETSTPKTNAPSIAPPTAPSAAPISSPAPVATSSQPTSAPTPEPTPSSTPEPKSVAPTSKPTTTPSPTSVPTSAPTSAPTPTSTSVVTVTLDAEKTDAPTTTAPTGGSANTNAGHTDHEEVDAHPMVLTVVGTVLVVVFLLVVAASIKINRNKKDHNWSRVKENEEEEEEDDEEGDEELGTRASRKSSHGKQLRSDDIDSDDDDEEEDEIFDRSSHDHEGTKHDTRVLERL